MISGGVIGAAYFALGGVLPPLFTNDRAILGEVGRVWWVVAALQPVGGVVFVLDGVLMGAGDFRFLFLSTALAALLGLVPIAVASVVFGWGLPGIWAGMAVMLVVRCLATCLRLRSGRWAAAA